MRTPRSNKGFTLVEVLICVAISLLILVPVLEVFGVARKAYNGVLERADLRTEADLASIVLRQTVTDLSDLKIDEDNRGLSLRGGGRVVWKDDKLYLYGDGPERVLLKGVQQAAFFRRDEQTFLSLVVASTKRTQTYRAQYRLGGSF